jgi:hypothetical protein
MGSVLAAMWAEPRPGSWRKKARPGVLRRAGRIGAKSRDRGWTAPATGHPLGCRSELWPLRGRERKQVCARDAPPGDQWPQRMRKLRAIREPAFPLESATVAVAPPLSGVAQHSGRWSATRRKVCSPSTESIFLCRSAGRRPRRAGLRDERRRRGSPPRRCRADAAAPTLTGGPAEARFRCA